jgi:HD-GYP domain-containing protein (c-di-GMP phosphodiesterase class II)
MSEMRRQAGSQFDPRVVDALCRHLEDVPSAESVNGDGDGGRTRSR